MNEEIVSRIVKEYEEGIAFKNSIDLYKTVNESERLFAGDQWAGLNAKNMPKPVFNIIKRIIQYKIAGIKSNPVSVIVSGEQESSETAKGLTSRIKQLWERMKLDAKNYSGLKDAALSGDYILYFYWDTTVKTGQPFTGDVNCEIIDNVNFFPGDPNMADIQRQPYIILAFRELTVNLKREAYLNNRPKDEIDMILPDGENYNQSGDISKYELNSTDKTLCFLKLYRDIETGSIFAVKTTKNVVIKDTYDTKLSLYPIAMMNWEERKNCIHGISEVYGLKPNQLFINKAFAQAMLNSMLFSFPKIIYDNSRIQQPSNTIGGTIAVNGNIEGAVKYLTPPSMSSDLFRLLDTTIAQTKELMGANDAALGNLGLGNTSAFIAIRDASVLPLEGVRLRFYQMVEDIGRIILDFITSYYKPGRMLAYDDGGEMKSMTVDYRELKNGILNLRVDVGPSNQIGEISAAETLDRLLQAEKISVLQYLKRMPEGYIPERESLIQELEEQNEQQLSNGQSDSSADGSGVYDS